MNALLTPEILTLFILESLLLLFLSGAFVLSALIAHRFDPASTNALQYALEKRSYLVAVIIRFSLLVKMVVFAYFIYGLDQLSNVITGAMCAAGVVTATPYGIYLMGLKLLNLFLFGFWLLLNRIDTSREDYPYTRVKFLLFLPLFLLIVVEYVLFWLHITALDPAAIVSCCGALFSTANTSLMGSVFTLPDSLVLGIFYALFTLILIFARIKNTTATLATSLLFLPVSLIALIAFFSTYIYELPTHRCPFCFLQKEYHYIGYLIYLLLFLGLFRIISDALARRFLDEELNTLRSGLVMLILFVALASYYPVSYYLKNGVFL